MKLKFQSIKYIDPRIVILIFGYVLLSELLNFWMVIVGACRRRLYANAFHRFPSRIKADFINWIGGWILTVIRIFLAGGEFVIAFSLLLFAVFSSGV